MGEVLEGYGRGRGRELGVGGKGGVLKGVKRGRKREKEW